MLSVLKSNYKFNWTKLPVGGLEPVTEATLEDKTLNAANFQKSLLSTKINSGYTTSSVFW